jgi:hypothetical protein
VGLQRKMTGSRRALFLLSMEIFARTQYRRPYLLGNTLGFDLFCVGAHFVEDAHVYFYGRVAFLTLETVHSFFSHLYQRIFYEMDLFKRGIVTVSLP